MLLQQEKYEDANGIPIAASKIAHVAACVYICDGFYSWTCMSCRKDNSSRAFKVNGVVDTCSHCFVPSLLLRSDCDQVNDLFRQCNILRDQIAAQEQQINQVQTKQKFLVEAADKLAEQVKSSSRKES